MLRTTRAQGRHHTTARLRFVDALAVLLSGAFLVIGVLIAMGPGEGSSPGDEAPAPVPEVSTKAPASVTVTR